MNISVLQRNKKACSKRIQVLQNRLSILVKEFQLLAEAEKLLLEYTKMNNASGRMKIRATIKEIVGKNPGITAPGIIEATGCKQMTIYQNVRKMVVSGDLVATKKSKKLITYTLPQSKPEILQQGA